MRNDWRRAANGSSSWPLRRQATGRCRIASRLTESIGRRNWDTLEEPIDLVGALRPLLHRYDTVLLDCLTLWVSNLLLRGRDPGSTRKEILPGTRRLLDLYRNGNASWIVVSNEVGLGVVPATELGRVYADELGRVNQTVAAEADDVYFMAAGLPLSMKPSVSEVPEMRCPR